MYCVLFKFMVSCILYKVRILLCLPDKVHILTSGLYASSGHYFFSLSLQTAFEDDRLSWLPSSAQQFLPRMTGMGRVVYMVPKQMYFLKTTGSFMSNTIFSYILCAQSGYIGDQDRATELELRVRYHFPSGLFALFPMSHGP